MINSFTTIEQSMPHAPMGAVLGVKDISQAIKLLSDAWLSVGHRLAPV